MLIRVLLMLALAVALAGCAASPAADPAASIGHPANPNAAEAPLPPPSQVLTAAPSNNAAPSAENPAPATGHAGHGMEGMAGMNHNMNGMDHARSSSQPATSQRQASVLYTCVMHPEVISDKPGKCPKCGMKLVPKRDGTPADHGGHE